jgi:hypothetical protein
MDTVSPPDLEGGCVRTLLALRHALADPLSSASLRLDLVTRRLTAPPGADPSWVLERVRAVQADVFLANRLLDLLLRLSEIERERTREMSLGELCRAAGVSFCEAARPVPSLHLRQLAETAAVQNVAAFARGDGVELPSGKAEIEGGRVTLTIEGARVTADGHPERLLDLPHGFDDAESLFVARAAVEADGGRLELGERGGRLVAHFSWPLREWKGAA